MKSPDAVPSPRRGRTAAALRAAALAAAALLATLVALAGVVPSAGAHGGPGNIALDSFTPKGAGSYEIRVKLTFAGDGDPVDEATVTLSGVSPEGQKLTPVNLAAEGDGMFAVTTGLPTGVWNLTVTSVEPEAQLALEPITVADPGPVTTAAGSTSAPATTTPGGSTVTTEGRVSALDGTSTTSGDGTAKEDVAAQPTASQDDGADITWPLLLVSAGVLGLLVALGLRQYFRAKEERDALDPPSGTSG